MSLIDKFFLLSFLVQIIHSLEEISTGYHKKWYLFKMPFWVFLLFEIVFEGFWTVIFLAPNFPNRTFLQMVFLVLMFANGMQHLVRGGIMKSYVPGLVTGIFHIIVFLIFYFQALTF